MHGSNDEKCSFKNKYITATSTNSLSSFAFANGLQIKTMRIMLIVIIGLGSLCAFVSYQAFFTRHNEHSGDFYSTIETLNMAKLASTENGIFDETNGLVVDVQKVVHIHIQKCGGTSAEKVFTTARDGVCGQGSSSYEGFEYERTFPFACSKNLSSIWPCGLHPSYARASTCTKQKMKIDDGILNRSVTSVLFLRNPLDRLMSEHMHVMKHRRSKPDLFEREPKNRTKCGNWGDYSLSTCDSILQNGTFVDFVSDETNIAANRMVWMFMNKDHRSTSWVGTGEKALLEATKNMKEISIIGDSKHGHLVYEALSKVFNITFDETLACTCRNKVAHKDYDELVARELHQNLNLINEKMKYDSALHDKILGKGAIYINWKSNFGHKLVELGLKDHYFNLTKWKPPLSSSTYFDRIANTNETNVGSICLDF